MESLFSAAHQQILNLYDKTKIPLHYNYCFKTPQYDLATVKDNNNSDEFLAYISKTKSTEIRTIEFGTTAVIAELDLERWILQLGNVGDSKAVLGTINEAGEIKVITKTEQHNLQNISELERIKQDFKDKVQVIDGKYLQAIHPHMKAHHLALTRSIGHKHLQHFGVIPNPQIIQVNIKNLTESAILILASDGVWDILSEIEALSIAFDYEDPQKAAEEIVESALKLNLNNDKDNTTAIVVHI